MDKIYIIVYCNGDMYEDRMCVNWTFCLTEEEAKLKIDELNKKLKRDADRFVEICDIQSSMCDFDYDDIESELNKEFEKLDGMYPYTQLDYVASGEFNAKFSYEELRKQ